MNNEKLGVLLIDVPEPLFWRYTYIDKVSERWFAEYCDSMDNRIDYIFKCTQEEAKKYPQFKWVPLEEL